MWTLASDSLKGVSGDVIILEEAAYCDPQLIGEVVVPLLAMQSSCLLCISTLLERGNHYSRMFELKSATGDPLFETMTISLVCEACMKTDAPEKCTHMLHEMPRWLSSQKLETVKMLLSDDSAMLLRESMGVSADSTQRAFASADIEAFVERARVRSEVFEHSVKEGLGKPCYVLLAVDPSGGGSSAFAVASVTQLTSGMLVVLGLDALQTRDVRATHALVIAHMHRVRQIRGLENAIVVLSLESNLAFEAQHIVHALQERKVPKWIALREGAGGSLGWLTTNERKEAMCFQLRDVLHVGNIALSAEFFSTSLSARDALARLVNEMRFFSILVDPPKSAFGKTRRTYSGKTFGNDDLVIALQLAITGLRAFAQNPKYRVLTDR